MQANMDGIKFRTEPNSHTISRQFIESGKYSIFRLQL